MSDNITIITNNQFRHLRCRNEVPQKILDENFSHLSEDETDGFFSYKNYWYHLTDFMIPSPNSFQNWDGYLSDTYFSGIVIELSDDMESVKVGRFYS